MVNPSVLKTFRSEESFRLENSDDDALQQVARQDGGKRPRVPDGEYDDAEIDAEQRQRGRRKQRVHVRLRSRRARARENLSPF